MRGEGDKCAYKCFKSEYTIIGKCESRMRSRVISRGKFGGGGGGGAVWGEVPLHSVEQFKT